MLPRGSMPTVGILLALLLCLASAPQVGGSQTGDRSIAMSAQPTAKAIGRPPAWETAYPGARYPVPAHGNAALASPVPSPAALIPPTSYPPPGQAGPSITHLNAVARKPNPTDTPSAPTPTPWSTLPVTTYISKELISGTYGPGPGQFIPRRFCCGGGDHTYFDVAANGDIYIADAEGVGVRRLNRYNSRGALVGGFSIPAISVTGVAVGNDGSIFLPTFDGKVNKFDPTGHLVATFSLAPLTAPGGISVDQSGKAYFMEYDRQGESRAWEEAGAVSPPTPPEALPYRLSPSLASREGRFQISRIYQPSKDATYPYRPGPLEALRIIRASGQSQMLWFNFDRWVDLMQVLDITADGSIYVAVSIRGEDKPDNPEFWVVKFDRTGKPVGRALFTLGGAGWNMRVDQAGNIYQLMVLPNGVHLYKWEAK